jgi:hypothetical protein
MAALKKYVRWAALHFPAMRRCHGSARGVTRETRLGGGSVNENEETVSMATRFFPKNIVKRFPIEGSLQLLQRKKPWSPKAMRSKTMIQWSTGRRAQSGEGRLAMSTKTSPRRSTGKCGGSTGNPPHHPSGRHQSGPPITDGRTQASPVPDTRTVGISCCFQPWTATAQTCAQHRPIPLVMPG